MFRPSSNASLLLCANQSDALVLHRSCDLLYDVRSAAHAREAIVMVTKHDERAGVVVIVVVAAAAAF